MEKKPYVLAIAVILIVLLSVYVCSYLILTEKIVLRGSGLFGATGVFRECEQGWMVNAYQPLASIEGKLTGEEVSLIPKYLQDY